MRVTRNPNLRQRTLMTAGFAAVVIVVITAYQIWHTYRAAVENAQRDSAQLVQIFAASSDATLQALELIADQAIAEVRSRDRTPQPDELDDRFITVAAQWPFVHAVLYTDPDGVARNIVVRRADGALHPADSPVNLTERDWFKFHRDADPSGQAIFLTDPHESALTGEPVINITKKVTLPDGSFAGVVSVGVTVESLSRIFAGLLPARYAGVGLFKGDGNLLAASPASADVGLPLRQIALPSGERGVVVGPQIHRVTDSGDGIERLAAVMASARYPVVVAVISPWAEALSPWSSASMMLATAAATGVIIVLALAWWQMMRIQAEQAAQLALAASERSLIESQRLAGIAHFERDIPSNTLSWSENMYAMHGVDPCSFTPEREALLELLVPEDRPLMKAHWDDINSGELVGSAEVRVRLPNGGIRHVQYGWRVLDGHQGTRPRIFGIAKDMTAMRAAEATIRADEERLRDIVECSGDYIWESDERGAVTFFSGGPRRIDFITGLDRAAADPIYARSDVIVLSQAIDARVKFRNLVVPATGEAGEPLWVRVSANPRFSPEGRFQGYRGAGTDVTELKHDQERDEHRRKSEALGRLAGGLAHEINNLLQPILIYASFGASSRTGDVQQYFSRIARAAEQATLIVKNVLTSSRQSPPMRENVEICAVLRETADLLGGTLPPAVSLEIACGCDPKDLLVRVDRTGLAQLVTNLVTNASEAMADKACPNGGRIEISVAPVHVSAEAARPLGLRAGTYCRLCVADEGPGIAREHLDKVFEPFFTTKPQGKGTGLGLSVVQGLAKSWGGAVNASSASGEPTRFVVYLPIAERQLQAAQ